MDSLIIHTLDTTENRDQHSRFPGQGKRLGGLPLSCITDNPAAKMTIKGREGTSCILATDDTKIASAHNQGLHEVRPGVSPVAECVGSAIFDSILSITICQHNIHSRGEW